VALWVVAGLAFLAAAVALASTRRLSRRLDAMTQSYWELRYDYTRLRSQVSRLDPEQVEEAAAAEAPPSAATVSFVPLSSIKKKP
jgi:acyl carrier protein phosphodiesterase